MTKKKQQFNWPMFVRAEDYPFRACYVQYPIIDGKISDHVNAAGESLWQRTIEDAIEDMHNEARERSSFYRNRHLFVQQRSKRKILETTVRTERFFTKYYIRYAKHDDSTPIVIRTKEDAALAIAGKLQASDDNKE